MRKALAVGFGLATAVATVMFACGGDDTSGGGGAGTTSGTAGSGTAGAAGGSAGSGTGTGGNAGSQTGAGGAIEFDGSFDFDAFVGAYTCADLTACCATLMGDAQTQCNMVTAFKNDQACSAALSALKQNGTCK